jgi:hypothetical protein
VGVIGGVLQPWRALAFLLGMGLMLGETLRSWGAGRHWIWVVDDFVIRIPLVVTAVLVARPTIARRCAFSAAWAATAGMLYSSFFMKLLDPDATTAGNWSLGWLTIGAGFAFVQSLVCLVASIVVRTGDAEPDDR